MARRHRKIRKLRGSRTCGWGIIGQHRCHGMIGGHGKAGIHKYKWVSSRGPKFLGRTGFNPPSSLRRRISVINIRELDELVSTLVANKKLTSEQGKIVVNLAELGYDKLLGGGKITKPLIVKTSAFSEVAAKKIKESGGQVITPD